MAPSASGLGVTEEEDRIVYDRNYFSQFNVISADDLLRRIPGVQDLLNFGESGERGFGSTGAQVLINGQRLSGKSNNVQSALARIQARQVLRIEVIRGKVPGLDVRSEGRVVNVVLEEEITTTYGSWEGSVGYSRAMCGSPAERHHMWGPGEVWITSWVSRLRREQTRGRVRMFSSYPACRHSPVSGKTASVIVQTSLGA